MRPDDLTRPLRKRTSNQWPRAIVLPIVAGTLSGVLSGSAILFTANPDRGKPLPPAPAPQSAVTDSVQPTAPIPATVPALPSKTITLSVIDSQTGAKREVVLPAPTSDQSQESEIAMRPTATIIPAERAGGRGAIKSKRH